MAMLTYFIMKLTFDAMWPADTSFKTAIGPLSHSIAPILSLRTNKSDPIVGLTTEKAWEMDALDPEWRYNGQWGKSCFFRDDHTRISIDDVKTGVIQCYEP